MVLRVRAPYLPKRLIGLQLGGCLADLMQVATRVPALHSVSTSFISRLRSFLPRGGSLPEDEWNRRHRALVVVLWINAVALTGYGIALGRYGVVHNVAHAAGIVTLAVLAGNARFSHKWRAAFASIGLLSAAALLVHLTRGLIEAHFYFFVLVVALTLYEDWMPFLLAVGYVLLHHGVVGTIDPHEVYNRRAEWSHPWTWAGIHAAFIALAGVAGITTWRLNENVRNRMRAAQNELARISETDSLTGLANRRKAMKDLECLFDDPREDTVLVLFDLNWFKSYNDTFGHPAGDALLERLGRQFASAVDGRATAYRLGGDEFCMLAPCREEERASLEAVAAAALSEHGQAFQITAAYGSVLIPAEAGSSAEALHLADERMYARKHSSRPSAISQSKGVLTQAMVESHPDLGGHLNEVARLVEPVARRLEMPDEEIEVLRHAAELHDIGKVAIPDAIMSKAGPLSESEREFIQRHTLVGQRIVAAAPVLAGVGELIRSSHEHWTGGGYPDGLAGPEIPLGARVIAVCDAYDAMTSDRPYRRALDHLDALAELRRCAGTQFDPDVVGAFLALMNEPKLRLVRPESTDSSVASQTG
jgi:diguanylate cyclase (GGDEF)-like protein